MLRAEAQPVQQAGGRHGSRKGRGGRAERHRPKLRPAIQGDTGIQLPCLRNQGAATHLTEWAVFTERLPVVSRHWASTGPGVAMEAHSHRNLPDWVGPQAAARAGGRGGGGVARASLQPQQ